MKITFVRPNMFPGRSSDAMEPLCFAVLKSLTPDDVETVLYDERIESVPLDEPTDLVAMTVETYTARRAYQLASQFRQRGIPVVMGGYHPTLLPQEALQFADAVVRGDAETVWPQVVQDARAGELQPDLSRVLTCPAWRASSPIGPFFPARSTHPSDWSSTVGAANTIAISVRFTLSTDRELRQRPVADVVTEIQRVGRQPHFLR